MTKLEKLIKELCPNGVEYRKLKELCISLSKGTLKQHELCESGFPVVNSGRDFYGKYKQCNNKGNAITIASRGEYAGFIKYINEDFWAGGLCYPYRSSDEKVALTKFIFYFLKNNETNIMDVLVSHGGVPALNKSDIDDYKVPLPPLAVQCEIVRILDDYTLLSAEFATALAVELSSRRKQYEYYRDKLLTFSPNGVICRTLGELGDFYGGLNGKSKADFRDGNAKFVTYCNVYSNPALNLDIEDRVKITEDEKQNTLQYGDIIFTSSSETPDECGFSSVITKPTAEKLYLNSFCFFFRFHDSKLMLPNFAKHLFRSENLREQIGKTASGVTRYNVSKDKMKKVVIPVPPLELQEKIVETLDKFDKLCNDLSEGLPAEIEARQKQYEYYRDKLLTF